MKIPHPKNNVHEYLIRSTNEDMVNSTSRMFHSLKKLSCRVLNPNRECSEPSKDAAAHCLGGRQRYAGRAPASHCSTKTLPLLHTV